MDNISLAFHQLQKQMKQKDPKQQAYGIRLFTEELVHAIYQMDRRISLKHCSGNTFADINLLYERRILSAESKNRLHQMRMIGNRGVHVGRTGQRTVTREDCRKAFEMAKKEYQNYEKHYVKKRHSIWTTVLIVMVIILILLATVYSVTVHTSPRIALLERETSDW